MADTAVDQGNKLLAYQRRSQREWPRLAEGGPVKSKHGVHLMIVIGLKPKVDNLRKRGLVSDKAHAKRRLP